MNSVMQSQKEQRARFEGNQRLDDQTTSGTNPGLKTLKQLLKPSEANHLEDSRQYLGRMYVTEILELTELQAQDQTKLKTKLRSAYATTSGTVLLTPYLCQVIGKEPGLKGRLMFDVYHLPG